MDGYVSYKGREIDKTKEVEVYRNLNNGKLSIRQGGKVMGHADGVLLSRVRPVVNQKGRERVLRERVKNVHAYLKGMIEEGTGRGLSYDGELYYDPYKVSEFTDKSTGEGKSELKYVRVTFEGKMYYCEE